MGDRYLEVPDSWEDRHTEAPSDDTVSTSASTQAGEETSELSVVVNPHPPQVPAPITIDSPPTKRTQPTDGLQHQSLLDSFLGARHSPGLPKKSHPPPEQSPPQSPSKKRRGLSIPSIQSSITNFFSPTPRTKRKKYGDTSPPNNHPPQSHTLAEDTVTFADVVAPIVNTSPMSDDTLQRPFSVDYLTKYRMPAGEVDSLPNDSDLEEVSCNESKQEVQVSDLFPEIDARYDQTDGVLEKEFDD
jgi:hypothetical protein